MSFNYSNEMQFSANVFKSCDTIKSLIIIYKLNTINWISKSALNNSFNSFKNYIQLFVFEGMHTKIDVLCLRL